MLRALAASICVGLVACAPAIRRTGGEPTGAHMSGLWVERTTRSLNLFDGPPSIDRARPEADARYDVLSRDTAGFSITYKVRDAQRREWNVKIGPESQTEVVASRLLWALGYHALPTYFVERWIAVDHEKGAKGALLGGARFRPHDLGLKSLGEWSWQQNPFVGTRQYGGLLALMMLLNSTDLKNQNNEIYAVPSGERDGASRWYVVKDLGASLGETGRMDPRRGNVAYFEREPFILGVNDGFVRFGYRGRHRELVERISIDDLRWACERLQQLSDRQLRDAFRAGHFTDEQTTRYVARLQEKAADGLALR